MATDHRGSQLMDRVTDAVRRAFPSLSPRAARFSAGALADAIDSAHLLFHNGREDRAALQSVAKAIERLNSSLDALSPWAREALSTALHQRILGRSPAEDGWRDRTPSLPPMTCDDLSAAAGEWRDAAAAADDIMSFGKREGQMKWRAVALIDEARRLWEARGGKPLEGEKKSGELSEGHPFLAFLDDLFDAFGLDASPRSQYRAWRDLEKHSQWGNYHP